MTDKNPGRIETPETNAAVTDKPTETSRASESQVAALKLMGEVLKTAKSVVLPEGFPELLLRGMTNSKDNNFGLTDKSADALKAAAAFGNDNGQTQLDKYFTFRDGKVSSKQSADELSPGKKEGNNGSSYVINDKGDTTTFTSRPTAGEPNGSSRNAAYNAKHELVALANPSGTSFKRTSAENDKGFAYWQAFDQQGQKVQVGSKSGPFVGKLSLDQDGAHIMVGHDKTNPSQNTKWAGMLSELRPDGSEIRTTVLNEKGENPGFETQTTMPDGTQVTSRSHYDKDSKTYKPDSEVTVLDANRDAKTVIKDGEIVSRETNLLAKERMKELVHSLESNSQLQNLQHADISSTKNGLHIVIDNAKPTYSAPMTLPGLTIGGTIPDNNRIGKHVSLDAKYSPEAHSIQLSHLQGVSGSGHQFGPIFGKQWDGGAVVDGMKIDPKNVAIHVNSVQVLTGGIGHRVAQKAANSQGPGWKSLPMSQLQPEMRESIGKNLDPIGHAIQTMSEETKHIGIDRTSAHGLKLETQPSGKLQAEVEKMSPLLDLDKDIKGKLSYDESGIKLTDIKGVKVLFQDIKELRLEPAKNGKFNISVDFENPLTQKTNTIPIPEDLARLVLSAAKEKK